MTNYRIWAIVLVLGIPTTLLAQQPAASPSATNSQDQTIADRMNRLETETQSLRSEVEWLREHPVRLPTVNAMPTNATPTGMASAPNSSEAEKEDYYTIDELRTEMKKFAWTKGDFTIVPYGWLWANGVYSTERTTPGSYTLYVTSASTVPESENFVDVRNTRLGFDVGGPSIEFFGGAKGGGKVEIDFQNSTLNALTTENKPTVLLRHCYAEVKNDDFRLLAGQTWDVISPLNPGMLMYSVGWDGGNIGYRRPQFRAERNWAFSNVSMVTTQFSINPQISSDTLATKTSGTITNAPSNWPIFEGRVGWTIGQRGPGCLPIVVGASGHIGEQEFDYAGTTNLNDQHRRTWSGNLDVRVPLTEQFGVQGECFIGENLASFLGGIGQGVDPVSLDAIRDAGGWIELWYDWTARLHSRVGYSVDDPNDNDIHYTGGRLYNQFYYGNLTFDVTKNFLLGLEVSSWKTLYLNQLPGDSVRCEFVAKYGF